MLYFNDLYYIKAQYITKVLISGLSSSYSYNKSNINNVTILIYSTLKINIKMFNLEKLGDFRACEMSAVKITFVMF